MTRSFCWHQNFVPLGLSAPILGLYTDNANLIPLFSRFRNQPISPRNHEGKTSQRAILRWNFSESHHENPSYSRWKLYLYLITLSLNYPSFMEKKVIDKISIHLHCSKIMRPNSTRCARVFIFIVITKDWQICHFLSDLSTKISCF